MLYEKWGFQTNPFNTAPLPASEAGEMLLVGRNRTLDKLKARIRNGPKVSTIEGLNGIGKTSIANVASFQLERESIDNERNTLFLPCRKIFQLSSRSTPEEFRKSVLQEVVQTLIERKNDLPVTPGLTKPNMNEVLDRYLNCLETTALQFGAVGASLGYSRSMSPTAGFDQSGFDKAALGLLESLFPRSENGGVICVIDNLEILETSAAAAQMAEELRDVLFSVPGIRWVMCGARGIVHGVASSPRIAGYLHRPIEVGDLGLHHAHDLFERRLSAFKARSDAAVPVEEADFLTLFELYRGNIRSVLDGLDEFCHYIDDNYDDIGDMVNHIDFSDWLDDEAKGSFIAISKTASTMDLQALAYSTVGAKSFKSDDFRKFGFEDQSSFSECLTRLTKWGVIWCIEDDKDHCQRVYRIAPKGWLVDYSGHLNRFRAQVHSMMPTAPPDEDWYKDGQKWSGDTATYPNEE